MWTWSRESDLDVVEDRLVLETDLRLEPPQAPGAIELAVDEPPGDVELVHVRTGFLHEPFLHGGPRLEDGRRVGEGLAADALDDRRAALPHDVEELVDRDRACRGGLALRLGGHRPTDRTGALAAPFADRVTRAFGLPSGDRVLLRVDRNAVHRTGGVHRHDAAAHVLEHAGGIAIQGIPVSPTRLRAYLEDVVVVEIRHRDHLLDVPVAREVLEPLGYLASRQALPHV